jgi:type I restriction enzyme R subunit
LWENKRRPDIIIYINGIPLVLLNWKNWFDENTISEAQQIQHYCKDIPLLFEYNALTIVSDGNGLATRMFNSSTEWYAAWKSIDRSRNSRRWFSDAQLTFGLFLKTVYCPIKNFIFEDHNGTLIKKELNTTSFGWTLP